MINQNLQEQEDKQFKTKFKIDIEREEKEQAQIINDYTGEGDIKPRPII